MLCCFPKYLLIAGGFVVVCFGSVVEDSVVLGCVVGGDVVGFVVDECVVVLGCKVVLGFVVGGCVDESIVV